MHLTGLTRIEDTRAQQTVEARLSPALQRHAAIGLLERGFRSHEDIGRPSLVVQQSLAVGLDADCV